MFLLEFIIFSTVKCFIGRVQLPRMAETAEQVVSLCVPRAWTPALSPSNSSGMNPNTPYASAGGFSSSHLPLLWRNSSSWQATGKHTCANKYWTLSHPNVMGQALSLVTVPSLFSICPNEDMTMLPLRRTFSLERATNSFRQQKIVSKETWTRLVNSDGLNLNGWSGQWALPSEL